MFKHVLIPSWIEEIHDSHVKQIDWTSILNIDWIIEYCVSIQHIYNILIDRGPRRRIENRRKSIFY